MTRDKKPTGPPPLTSEDEAFLRRAIALSSEAAMKGCGEPYGCVIVERRKQANGAVTRTVVIEAWNGIESENDITAHAEMTAVRYLGKLDAALRASPMPAAVDVESIEGYELFTSTEPCVMCAGAIYACGLVDRIVYSCPLDALADFTGDDDFLLSCREVLARGTRKLRLDGPALQHESEAVHRSFWPQYLASQSAAAVTTDADQAPASPAEPVVLRR
jgi:tRNA(Arg) A34 adenosine deaminase TadA